MPPKKTSESPLTFSQLVKFYKEVIDPGFDKRLASFYKEVIEPGFDKRLTSFYKETVEPGFDKRMNSHLIKFYNGVVEPGFERKIEEKLEEKIRPLRNEMNQHFDDLYKKFEDLKQEYIIVKHQMKRFDDYP